MRAGPVCSLLFFSLTCSVFLCCDFSTVTVFIRGSRELPCCFVDLAICDCTAKEHVCLIIFMRCTIVWESRVVAELWSPQRDGTSFERAVLRLVQMSACGETGSQGGEETAGGEHQRRTMGQLSGLLGRPKCFSGREDEWHDWSLKLVATPATLSDHARVWMGDALKMNAEITLDQPNQAAARILRDSCIPCSLICVRDEHWHSFEEHLITMVCKRGDCYLNGISRRRGRGVWLC